MSTTYSGVISKSFSALLGGKIVKINLSTDICMYNDYKYGSSWGGNVKIARSAVERRKRGFSKLKLKPEYFVDGWNNPKKAKDLVGCAIYKLPNNFNGVHVEWDWDDYETVGTVILQDNGSKIRISNNLNEIEEIRRNIEVERMKKGLMTIFFSNIEAECKDAIKYQKYLISKDLKNGSMATRGHGFDTY